MTAEKLGISRDLFSVKALATDRLLNSDATRSEHSRNLEQRRRYRAIETLVEAGLFKRMLDCNTYHGRATEDPSENWSVRTDFSNGGNSTGNYNANRETALYTADHEIATQFAVRRSAMAKALGGVAFDRVHEIVSLDPDAVLVTRKRIEGNVDKVTSALKSLLPKVLDGVFSANDDRNGVARDSLERANELMSENGLTLWRYYKEETDQVKKILNRINTAKLLLSDPYYIITRSLLAGKKNCTSERW